MPVGTMLVPSRNLQGSTPNIQMLTCCHDSRWKRQCRNLPCIVGGADVSFHVLLQTCACNLLLDCSSGNQALSSSSAFSSLFWNSVILVFSTGSSPFSESLIACETLVRANDTLVFSPLPG